MGQHFYVNLYFFSLRPPEALRGSVPDLRHEGPGPSIVWSDPGPSIIWWGPGPSMLSMGSGSKCTPLGSRCSAVCHARVHKLKLHVIPCRQVAKSAIVTQALGEQQRKVEFEPRDVVACASSNHCLRPPKCGTRCALQARSADSVASIAAGGIPSRHRFPNRILAGRCRRQR